MDYLHSYRALSYWRPLVIAIISCLPLYYHIAYAEEKAGVISLGSTLKGNDSWLSPTGMFAIGLFQLQPNSATYLGIWYAKITSPFQTRIIWVANRDTPASTSASIHLRLDGNLLLLDQDKIIWMTNTSRLNVSSARLQDSGNFVPVSNLNTSENGAITVWESFDTPFDTLIPGMKFPIGSKLTSWKDSNDPASGQYSIIIGEEYALTLSWRSNVTYWTSGPFDGRDYPALQLSQRVNPRYNQISLTNTSRGISLFWNSTELYERIQINHKGYFQLQQYIPLDNIDRWQLLWLEPSDPCATYEACGPYGLCTPHLGEDIVMECSCPTGFRASDSKSWDLGDYSKGCVRSIPLNCSHDGGGSNSNDKFLELSGAVYSGGSNSVGRSYRKTQALCLRQCLSDCSCVAYSYEKKNGSCSTFLNNFRLGLRSSSSASVPLYMRVAAQERLIAITPSVAPAPKVSLSLSEKSHKIWRIVLFIGVPLLLIVACGILLWKLWIKKRGSSSASLRNFDLTPGTPHRMMYEDLRIITKNFSHKLGSGGFGDVYKGFLSDNRVVAVKKLKKSRQREKEFYSEVLTIGAIHHQNLVRLLAFCVEGNHRLLVYEFLENSSLDKFLFNKEKRKILSWSRRFSIALGTARGLAYIHEECRDRIMHFDVKPANILLDQNFNAKLADFGTAKLMDRDMSRVITRARGTRGYMAPEWLSRIPITSKTDVYSYGMTLLEIVGGRKNLDFDAQSDKLFLPEWASVELSKGDVTRLADIEMKVEDEMEKAEVDRAVKVALWCIQDDPETRPSMATVVQLLQADILLSDPPIPLPFRKSETQTSSYDI